jgi:hypothetical protein
MLQTIESLCDEATPHHFYVMDRGTKFIFTELLPSAQVKSISNFSIYT